MVAWKYTLGAEELKKVTQWGQMCDQVGLAEYLGMKSPDNTEKFYLAVLGKLGFKGDLMRKMHMLSNDILIGDFREDEAAMLPGSAENFVNSHVLSLKDYAGLADNSQHSPDELSHGRDSSTPSSESSSSNTSSTSSQSSSETNSVTIAAPLVRDER